MHHPVSRTIRRMVAVVACVLVPSLVLSMPVSAQDHAPSPNPANVPLSLQSQLHAMTNSQLLAYEAKIQLLKAFEQAQGSGVQPQYCVPQCVPNYRYEYMKDVLEGGSDTWCGPATAEEMYSSYNYYFAGDPYVSQSTAEQDMASAPSPGPYFHSSTGTDLPGIAWEMNHRQSTNYYVMQHLGGAGDVYDYTAVDIGGYYYPVAYDGETDGYYSHPLYPQYATVNWTHWFPAYGYDANYNVYVADVHFDANYAYTDTAIYHFIFDLLGSNNAVITW